MADVAKQHLCTVFDWRKQHLRLVFPRLQAGCGHTPALTASSKVEQTDRAQCESGGTVQAGSSSPRCLVHSRTFANVFMSISISQSKGG